MGRRNGRRRCGTITSATVKPGTGVHGSFYSLPRRLSGPRSDLQGPLRPAADAHDDRFPRERAQTEPVLTDKFAEIIKTMGAQRRRQEIPHSARTTSRHIRRRISTAAPSWAPIPRPARQPLSAKLGRAELVRAGRQRVPAERRLQPDRHGRGARLLGGGGHPQPVSQKPGAAGRCLARATNSPLRPRSLARRLCC